MRPFGFAGICTILGLALLLKSCVKPYQPDTASIPRALVVEGLITDQPGPYTVRLTWTADYTATSLNYLVTGATVTLFDNAGNAEVLQGNANGGIYQTQTMRGIPGRSYWITIQLNGKTYQSNAEVLRLPPPIKQLYYKYKYSPAELTNDLRNGWDVYVDTQDPDTLGNYYRWSWTHYEFQDACYITESPTGNIGLPCCSACWDISRCYSNCITISSDASINGKAISGQYITTVPYTSTDKYYLEVEQQALSPGAYQFFNSVNKLVSNTGGLFDAAPSSVQGNIRCVTDPAETVYGYFGAAGSTVQAIKVDRSKDAVGNPVTPLQVTVDSRATCVECENSIYRTPNQPRWWNM